MPQVGILGRFGMLHRSAIVMWSDPRDRTYADSGATVMRSAKDLGAGRGHGR